MRFAAWARIAAAAVLAVPFGWGLGVFIADVVGGRDFGQLPVLTVPLGIVAAVVFAFLPVFTPATRLTVMAAGCVLFILWARLAG
jgi:hypothetical protein